jgi:hypothetical protein
VNESINECPYCGGKSFSVFASMSAYLTFPVAGSASPNLPEITEAVPSPKFESTFTVKDERVTVLQEEMKQIRFELADLREAKVKAKTAPETLYLPKDVEEVTPPGILFIVRDVQKCYEHGVPNACPPLLRKALLSAIKIKFYRNSRKDLIFDNDGNRRKDWIGIAKRENYLSPELAKELRSFRIFGDTGAHDEIIRFDDVEVDGMFKLIRLVIEHLLKVNAGRDQ